MQILNNSSLWGALDHKTSPCGRAFDHYISVQMPGECQEGGCWSSELIGASVNGVEGVRVEIVGFTDSNRLLSLSIARKLGSQHKKSWIRPWSAPRDPRHFQAFWGRNPIEQRSRCHSVLGIPFSYYCSVLGVPRYPPGMPSLVFRSSPPKNSGFCGKIGNVLEMDSAK